MLRNNFVKESSYTIDHLPCFNLNVYFHNIAFYLQLQYFTVESHLPPQYTGNCTNHITCHYLWHASPPLHCQGFPPCSTHWLDTTPAWIGQQASRGWCILRMWWHGHERKLLLRHCPRVCSLGAQVRRRWWGIWERHSWCHSMIPKWGRWKASRWCGHAKMVVCQTTPLEVWKKYLQWTVGRKQLITVTVDELPQNVTFGECSPFNITFTVHLKMPFNAHCTEKKYKLKCLCAENCLDMLNALQTIESRILQKGKRKRRETQRKYKFLIWPQAGWPMSTISTEPTSDAPGSDETNRTTRRWSTPPQECGKNAHFTM